MNKLKIYLKKCYFYRYAFFYLKINNSKTHRFYEDLLFLDRVISYLKSIEKEIITKERAINIIHEIEDNHFRISKALRRLVYEY